jgi:uncharacterized repeat protein (TIGR03803 family)
MLSRYLLLGTPVLALALAACSSQSVTPSAAQNVTTSSVDSLARHGRRYDVIYEFPGGAGGQTPVGGLAFINGAMFGATYSGGDVSGCDCGTVFAGTKVIYSFKGVAGKDGATPLGTLLPVGNKLYGVTLAGGLDDGVCSSHSLPGCGTVYEVDAGGKERVIYRFKGGSDGESPAGGLVSLNGTLYGVTTAGGVSKTCIYSSSPPGCGVIFALDSSGHEKVIYRFKGPPDGAIPLKALFPFDGKLYGTTFYGGGCSNSAGGCGTVFGVTTSGKESVIYSFEGGHDGQSPNAPLVALNGSLWGTTFQGGCVKSCQYGTFGTIFKMSTSGHETIVHRFTDLPDGAFPQGPLAVVNNTIYGTTSSGGTRRRAGGTIFGATSTGVRILHSFGAAPNGYGPGVQGLTLDDSTKALYGTTVDGGRHGAGTIFRYTP